MRGVMVRRVLVLLLSVLLIVGAAAPVSAATSAATCAWGITWTVSPNSPSIPPSYLGAPTTILAPVGTTFSVTVTSVPPNPCAWAVYLGGATYSYPDGGAPAAGTSFSAPVTLSGLSVAICYEQCTNTLGEWFYAVEPAAGSVPAVPPGQTLGASPSCLSSCPAKGFAVNPTSVAGEPVNVATGAFETSAQDLRLGGDGYPFTVDRTYNSGDAADGLFGPGWSSGLDASLSTAADGTVTFRAHFTDRGRPGRHEERSRFVREGGRWFYLDAEPG
jgi:hypothetical protein